MNKPMNTNGIQKSSELQPSIVVELCAGWSCRIAPEPEPASAISWVTVCIPWVEEISG